LNERKIEPHELQTPSLDWSNTDNFECGDWVVYVATKTPEGKSYVWGAGTTRESLSGLSDMVAQVGQNAERAYQVLLRHWGLEEYDVCPKCGEKKLVIHKLRSHNARYAKSECDECDYIERTKVQSSA
jgi:ssDNA-binding Zn-finger/Zn-ribbon topoisomerase 1